MKAYLMLENGRVFVGEHIGADVDAVGTLVFNTCMTGYQEILTDPVSAGQLVAMTYPLVGNYGVNEEDFESPKATAKGLIVRNLCERPSNFRCTGTLNDFLKAQGVAGIAGIDTRSLTREIRSAGRMNAVITTNPDYDKQSLSGVETQANTHYGEKAHIGGNGNRVVMYDFGAPKSLVNTLSARGYDITVLPSDAKADDAKGFDGVILSCGPADPGKYTQAVETAKALLDTGVPMLGIGLGFELMALASGAKTLPLKQGHHGVNHPVLDKATGRTYLTNQNRDYQVDINTVDANNITYVNVNDASIEGMSFTPNAFGVQFHPNATESATGTGFVFARFEEMMKGATR
ncbi:MAG: carbamoyl phosphate synthase small subunit [Ruminococcaceae bacterium]|nr:carbamoyl phosphate synthase small subunit [Oscillospiraceae bacterium]